VSFDGTSWSYPQAGVIQGSDGNLYGTTSLGGSANYGTVFQVKTNGELATLVSFANTNTNGVGPDARLTQGSDGNFYGTTAGGGSYGGGTVFRVTASGALTTLVSFAKTNGPGPSGLTLGNDGNFYGTTAGGGAYDMGTVFRMTTNGALTTLASFAG